MFISTALVVSPDQQGNYDNKKGLVIYAVGQETQLWCDFFDSMPTNLKEAS